MSPRYSGPSEAPLVKREQSGRPPVRVPSIRPRVREKGQNGRCTHGAGQSPLGWVTSLQVQVRMRGGVEDGWRASYTEAKRHFSSSADALLRCQCHPIHPTDRPSNALPPTVRSPVRPRSLLPLPRVRRREQQFLIKRLIPSSERRHSAAPGAAAPTCNQRVNLWRACVRA